MIAFKKCFFDNWFNVLKLTAQRKKAAKKFQIALTFFNNWNAGYIGKRKNLVMLEYIQGIK